MAELNYVPQSASYYERQVYPGMFDPQGAVQDTVPNTAPTLSMPNANPASGTTAAYPNALDGVSQYSAPLSSPIGGGSNSTLSNIFGSTGAIATALANPVLGLGVGIISGISNYISNKEAQKKQEQLVKDQAKESKRRWEAEYKLAKEKLGLTYAEFAETKKNALAIEKAKARQERIAVNTNRVQNLLGMINSPAGKNLAAANINLLKGGMNA